MHYVRLPPSRKRVTAILSVAGDPRPNRNSEQLSLIEVGVRGFEPLTSGIPPALYPIELHACPLDGDINLSIPLAHRVHLHWRT